MKVQMLFDCKAGDRFYKVGDSGKRVLQVRQINNSYGMRVYSVDLTNGKVERKNYPVCFLRNVNDPKSG